MTSRIALILAGCMLANFAAAQEGSENSDAATTEIETQRCISTRQLKSNVVVDDSNILFFMIGTSVYHNRLPEVCNGLLEFKTFTYRQIAGRICEGDVINVAGNNNASVARRCRLGIFDEIDSQDIPALISTLHRPPKSESLPSADVEEVTDAPESGDPQPPE